MAGSLQLSNLDISEPKAYRRVTFVLGTLQGNMTFVKSAEIGPYLKLSASDEPLPIVVPQIRIDDLMSVLEELHMAFIGDDFELIPLRGFVYPFHVR